MDDIQALVADFFVSGGIAMISLYHLILFAYRRRDRAALHFFFLGLLMAVRVVSSGNVAIISVVPALDTLGIVGRLDYLTIYLIPVSIAFFTRALYPEVLPALVTTVTSVVGGSSAIFTLVAPTPLYEGILPFFHVFCAMLLIVGVTVAIRIARCRLPGYLLFIPGYLILLLGAMNDILVSYALVDTALIFPYVLFVFILFQSAMLAHKSTRAFEKVERFSRELLEKNRIVNENLELRERLGRQTQKENELSIAFSRLSELLNSVREMVIAVDSEVEICYLNKPAETELGYSADELLGHPLSAISKTPEETMRALADLEQLTEHREIVSIDFLRRGRHSASYDCLVSSIEIEDDSLYAILFRHDLKSDAFSPLQTEILFEEISRNRKRVANLRSALTGIPLLGAEVAHGCKGDLQSLDAILSKLGTLFSQKSKRSDRRKLAVEVMTKALAYWEESTGLPRAELAEISGIWSYQVYPDGWRRTQVLDRYLDLGTIPRIPRWKKVQKTAEFVLSYCTTESTSREELSASLRDYILAE